MAKKSFRGYDNHDTTGSGDGSHYTKTFSQGIEWGKTQVGAEGGPNSESSMSVEGESNPARNRAASGSKKG